MTLNQLETLTDDELAMCLHVVNVIFPQEVPKIEFTPKQLTWFRHDMLVQKLLNAFPRLKPEGHSIFVSLLEKLGVKIEIKKIEPAICPTQNEITSSCEPSTNTGTGSLST